jgi:hypothetical protein
MMKNILSASIEGMTPVCHFNMIILKLEKFSGSSGEHYLGFDTIYLIRGGPFFLRSRWPVKSLQR